MFREMLRLQNEEAILFDGFDQALIGVGSQYPSSPVAVYSEAKILEELQAEMSFEDAVEYYEHNIMCLHAGKHTPIIVCDNGEVV